MSNDVNELTYKWLIQIKGITPKLAKALVYYFDIEDKECAAQFISYAGLNTERKEIDIKEATEIVKDTESDIFKISDQTGWSTKYLAKARSEYELTKLITRTPYNKDVKTLLWKIGKSFQMQDPKFSLYRLLYDKKYNDEIESGTESSYAEAKALRYIEKIFLSHLFEAMYIYNYNKMPPRYYNSNVFNIAPEVKYRNE